jgi:hypothetical protein
MYPSLCAYIMATVHRFVNVCAAQLKIPLTMFMPSVFIGLAPYNFLACRAGLVLRQLTSQRDIIDTSATIQVCLHYRCFIVLLYDNPLWCLYVWVNSWRVLLWLVSYYQH